MAIANVLLTGATGFIGGAAAVELLRRTDCRLLMLARGDRLETAEARVQESLARFTEPGFLASVLTRCTTICGNLTDAATMADLRLDQVTHVLHLAANTSFRSVRSVRHTNILGTFAL